MQFGCVTLFLTTLTKTNSLNGNYEYEYEIYLLQSYFYLVYKIYMGAIMVIGAKSNHNH